MSAGKHRRWLWPWTPRPRTEGMGDAGRAVETSLRDLGAIEGRTPRVDDLAARARTARAGLEEERRINHFNDRIRKSLAGGRPA